MKLGRLGGVAGIAAVLAITAGAATILAAPANAASISPSPTRVISGDATLLDQPQAMVVAPDGAIWVANYDPPTTTGSILEFAAGATGNVAPDVDIVGDNTGLQEPDAIAIDSSGNVWVLDADARAVFEFAAGATGNVAPIDTISGASTELTSPGGIAIAADGSIYVSNFDGTPVEVFAPGASGNAAPSRVIDGSNTGLDDVEPWGIALRSNGVLAVGSAIGVVETFAPNATGNVSPTQILSGSATTLVQPFAVAFDSSGNVYAADEESPTNLIDEFLPTANGNATPVNFIPQTPSFAYMNGFAIDSNDNLYTLVDGFGSQLTAITEYPPLFTLDSVTDPSGSTVGGQTVDVHGVGFQADASVTFGGVPSTDIHVVAPTEITAMVPAHAIGAVAVTVSQADGTETQTLADGYTYVAALPTTGVDPTPGMIGSVVLIALGGVLVIGRRRFFRSKPSLVRR